MRMCDKLKENASQVFEWGAGPPLPTRTSLCSLLCFMFNALVQILSYEFKHYDGYSHFHILQHHWVRLFPYQREHSYQDMVISQNNCVLILVIISS